MRCKRLVWWKTKGKTVNYLIRETSEGKVYWINEENLKNKKLADDFDKLLEIFNK